jgi:NodT family efflux transporter outer membrane factor (OMF) lipoprotein
LRPQPEEPTVFAQKGRPVAALAVAAYLLSACAVGPNYRAPEISLRDFKNAAAARGPSAGVIARLDQWWIAFNDPVLTRIIERALDQNLDLAAAAARVSQARAAASAAGARLAPSADLSAQASIYRQSLDGAVGEIARTFPGYRRDQRLFDVGATASWELDIFGGLRRGAQAARAEAQVADAARLGTRISVAAESGDAYFRIRGDQARIAVTQQQIDVDAHLLELVTARRARGVSSDRELAQSEALLKQAKSVLPLLRTDLEAQLNRLDVLMGAQPGTYAKELGGAADIPPIPAIPGNDHPVEVLRRRPDIIAAERRVAAASARIGVALSDYYPKISLSGLLGYESLVGKNLFTPEAFQPVGTGAIRWRLFDFGRVRAEVAAAHGADAEALAQYQQSVLHAAEDVENAFFALVETRTRTQELEGEVASLARAQALSEESYESGVIPLTDVLDSDRLLLSARDDLAQSRADDARAAVRVFRALGGGWSG